MKKAIICVAIMLLFGMTFHSNADSINFAENQTESGKGKTTFTKEELLEDYDQLWKDLETNYPFFPVLEEEGIDLEQVYQKGREQIKNRVSDLKGFLYVLKSVFSEMQNFAHLQILSNQAIASIKLSYENEKEYNGQDSLWLQIIHKPQVETTYAQKDMQKLLPDVEADIPVDAAYLAEIETLYFHFKSFQMSIVERDRHVIRDYAAALGDVPIEHIIFDITGNPGGSTAYWQDNIVALFPGEYTYEQTVFYNDTPLNRYFYKDFLDYTPISEFPTDSVLPDFVEQLQLSYYTEIEGTVGQNTTSLVPELSDAKRWLLTDKTCYSASDQFAHFCKETGWATLVGTATGGDGAVNFTPAMLELKNTGLLVYFSTLTAANSDGTLNAKRGTAPDVFSKQGESALDTCIRMIKSK